MNITFSHKKHEILANDDSKRVKELGKKGADIYKRRIDQLLFVESLEELRHLPGHYHELTSNRKGQWACDLEQPKRLIFIPHKTPIPVNETGQYIWSEITGVEIIEITDYHK